ncbi:MAG: hypothetical protein ACI8ZT_002286 [Bacteroidia bacterium]
MNSNFRLQHYNPGRGISSSESWEIATQVLRQVLKLDSNPKSFEWPDVTEHLHNEGVLRYVAYYFLNQNLIPSGFTRDLLKNEVFRGEAEKLSDDHELSRIFRSAKSRDLKILVIKGEALARTMFPIASCRPTSDYDMLIHPNDVTAFQKLFSDLGYNSGKFAGLDILGQQTWNCSSGLTRRTYVVDLHWYITNRRFFRLKIDQQQIFDDATEVEMDVGSCWIPSKLHSLLIACIHLGAADVESPVQLRWLLDIRLLLEDIADEEFDQLIVQTRDWQVLDVLMTYCHVTDQVLGPCRHNKKFNTMVKQISDLKRRIYKISCDHRWFDLLEYGLRLNGWKARKDYWKQIKAYKKYKETV